MGPSPPVGFPLPKRTWERVAVVKDHLLRRCDQLGKVGEERGREPHSLRPLGSVTELMSPSPPVGFPLPKRTWERVAVVKDHLLPRCGQLEKALEARDPVRLKHGLKLVEEQEGRSIL